jgi:hypothetical protein
MVTPDGSTVPIRVTNPAALNPAAAFVPTSLIASFAGVGPDYKTLAENKALTASREAAQVQAPLLAAAESGRSAAGGIIAQAFGRDAIPGLVVILATALLAAVGSAHYRVWQARRLASGNRES